MLFSFYAVPKYTSVYSMLLLLTLSAFFMPEIVMFLLLHIFPHNHFSGHRWNICSSIYTLLNNAILLNIFSWLPDLNPLITHTHHHYHSSYASEAMKQQGMSAALLLFASWGNHPETWQSVCVCFCRLMYWPVSMSVDICVYLCVSVFVCVSDSCYLSTVHPLPRWIPDSCSSVCCCSVLCV